MFKIFQGVQLVATIFKEDAEDMDYDTGNYAVKFQPTQTSSPQPMKEIGYSDPDKPLRESAALDYYTKRDWRDSIHLLHITDKKLCRSIMDVLKRHEIM